MKSLHDLRQRDVAWYGMRADAVDRHDHLFEARRATALPRTLSYRDKLPACWDQGEIGSCTGHGVGALIRFRKSRFMPSRLMLYLGGRIIERTVKVDAGAEIRDVVKAAAKAGVCDEQFWKYDIAKFDDMPPAEDFIRAKRHQIEEYRRVQIGIDDFRHALCDNGPIAFGFEVPESFEEDGEGSIWRTGIMKMPGTRERNVGGHCVAAIGYDDDRKLLECRNSWNTDWGDKGNFWMPYDFASDPDQVSDAWIITVVE